MCIKYLQETTEKHLSITYYKIKLFVQITFKKFMNMLVLIVMFVLVNLF